MTAATMTQKQRAAIEAMETARKHGCSLTQYARMHGLNTQRIYATLSALRKQGLLPKPDRKRSSPFVAVRVQAPSAKHARVAARRRGVSGNSEASSSAWSALRAHSRPVRASVLASRASKSAMRRIRQPWQACDQHVFITSTATGKAPTVAG